MKRNKSGVSLIVLVITIIVMIILAAAIIISLNNAGIINKANEAVDTSNLKAVQNIATLAWSEAYLDSLKGENVNIQERVRTALENQGITETDYYLNFTDSGVDVLRYTLGDLIINPEEDYGKTVNYKANGVEEWQVYYEDKVNGYVFLIAKEPLATTSLSTTEVTTDINNLHSIFKLGNTEYTLSNNYVNNKAVAWLISNYSSYANTTENYKNYVVGAIGGPTIELLAAGYNEKYKTTAITPLVDKSINGINTKYFAYNGEYGYFLNKKEEVSIGGLINDGLYLGNNYVYWLASPSGGIIDDEPSAIMTVYGVEGYDSVLYDPYWYSDGVNIRPVVCLKSDIPAKLNATETGYIL